MNPTRMSRIESAIRIVLEFNQALNCHDVKGMMQLMSDDCVFENASPAPDGSVYSGKAELTKYWQNFFSESPRAHVEIEDIFGLGFRCIMRWRYDWVDSTGKKGHIRGVDLFELKQGLICKCWSYLKA